MSDGVLYRYNAPKAVERKPAKDADGNDVPVHIPEPPHLTGVPARDLTEADLANMPKWLQNTIAASDLYTATPEGKKRSAKQDAPASADNVPPHDAEPVPAVAEKAS